ncbi:hypothetical protein L873DRAFT_1894669 [Choiromyces venosus 120613-1]|uniref:DDE Tnp4 domain-containing protein n=1 Tax=Choiromyces venosus 120613-1 TaxID=1336337 RepID=A0A3N4J5E0_9PEZI|nr:hypothetical protein L873DRAFT_1894669 [Choiromyces venosus 120613-1]
MLAQQFLHKRSTRRLILLQHLRLALAHNNSRKRGPLREGGRLDLDSLTEEEWRNQFRFTQSEVEELVEVLQLPNPIRANNRITEDRRTALCMLLARLAYPNHLCDLALKFGWPVERVSHISTATQTIIHDQWEHLLCWDAARLTPDRLVKYAHAIEQKGAPIGTVWGFIDGMIRGIARPTYHQCTCYNGWKRKHCLKYHGIVTPDGLISHLFGPVDGRRNDAFLWQESNLPNILERNAYAPNGTPLQVYGDPAYSINSFILSPYQGARLTNDQKQWNRSMSRLRIVAEWAFKEIVNTFGFLDFVKNQKHLLQPVGVQFRVAVLLHNAHVCLHKPQVTQYLNIENVNIVEGLMEDELLEPPLLSEYFHN